MVLLVAEPGNEDRGPALLVLGNVLVETLPDSALPEVVELLSDACDSVRRALDDGQGVDRERDRLHDRGKGRLGLLEVGELAQVNLLGGVPAGIALDLDLHAGTGIELDLVDVRDACLLPLREHAVVVAAHPEQNPGTLERVRYHERGAVRSHEAVPEEQGLDQGGDADLPCLEDHEARRDAGCDQSADGSEDELLAAVEDEWLLPALLGDDGEVVPAELLEAAELLVILEPGKFRRGRFIPRGRGRPSYSPSGAVR